MIGTLDTGEKVLAALHSGSLGALLVVDEIPGGAPWSDDLVAAIAATDTPVVAVSFSDGAVAKAANVALPGLHWTEKDGTTITSRGRVQRMRAAVVPPNGARTTLDVLQELARGVGLVPRVLSAGGVFRRLAAAQPATFGDMSYQLLGGVGLPLADAEDQMLSDECTTYYPAGPTSRGPGRALDEQTRISVHRESPVGYGTVRGSD